MPHVENMVVMLVNSVFSVFSMTNVPLSVKYARKRIVYGFPCEMW